MPDEKPDTTTTEPSSGDSEDETRDTYTPRKTHVLQMEQEAPHGEMRSLTYTLKEGFTYDVVEGEEADAQLGTAPVNNVAQIVRTEALPNH
jgi:hypothetical protein